MDTALCTACNRRIPLRDANGTVYSSQQIIGYYSDGSPLVVPIWRLTCYGGCARKRTPDPSLTQDQP